MRRRNNVGAVVDLDEVDDGELQSFLQRFDIGKEFVFTKIIFRTISEHPQPRHGEHYQPE
jgi:hypothetical protein